MEKFEFENLQEEDINKCQSLYTHIAMLEEFGNRCKPSTFKFLFGEKMGIHLFEIFATKSNRDVMNFINKLDEGNKKILITNIVMFKPRHSSEGNKLYFK